VKSETLVCRSREAPAGAAPLLALLYLLGVAPCIAAPQDPAPAAVVTARFEAMQRTWSGIFATHGLRFVNAELVLFREAVNSGCGPSRPAMGSFYCAADRMVYADLGVLLELRRRFAASADLAMTYILAHELAHHVQALLRVPRSQDSERQADCLAGVSWHAVRRDARQRAVLEKAIEAAVAAGSPDASAQTHGSPAQRISSFRSGVDSGRISACLEESTASFANP
jgi:predicted metalloprotease